MADTSSSTERPINFPTGFPGRVVWFNIFVVGVWSITTAWMSSGVGSLGYTIPHPDADERDEMRESDALGIAGVFFTISGISYITFWWCKKLKTRQRVAGCCLVSFLVGTLCTIIGWSNVAVFFNQYFLWQQSAPFTKPWGTLFVSWVFPVVFFTNWMGLLGLLITLCRVGTQVQGNVWLVSPSCLAIVIALNNLLIIQRLFKQEGEPLAPGPGSSSSATGAVYGATAAADGV